MKRLDRLLKVSMVAAITATSGAGGIVSAQGLVLEEIVVTARKVEESIQDVPVSISAFSAEQIKQRSVEELEDIALQTPGLTFEDFSNGGFGAPVVRGASQFSITALEQNVSTFFDGVYIPRNYALDLGTASLERVEVVKGPQSALYGANSFLGAINYVTTKPDLEEFGGTVKATIGDDGREDISAEVSIPLVTDRLAIKVGVGSTEYDGDILNSHPAANDGPSFGTDDSLGGWDKDSYSINLLATPTDNLNIELAYHNFDVFTESRAQTRLELGDLNCGGMSFLSPGNFRGFCGELPSTPLAPGSSTPTGFLVDPRSIGLDSETDILRAAISGNLTENLSLSYQFANIEGEVFSTGISDRNPLTGQDLTFFGLPGFFNAFTVLPVGGFDYDSHELKLEFSGDNGLYAMVGVFDSDGIDADTGQGGFFAPLFTDSLAPITEANIEGSFTRNNAIIETETSAIFARVQTPLFNENLTLSIEGRYTDETKSSNIVYNDGSSAQDRDEDYFTPRVSLDYRLSDDTLIYASYAEGVKAGGFNVEIAGSLELQERTFDEDENDTIELGIKTTLLDGAMQLNATAYYIDWTNLQVTQGAINGGFFTNSIIGNLGEATSKGVELDLTYALTPNLTFNGGLALNDATYNNGTVSQRLDRASICDDIVCNSNGDISGNELPRSSDTQWNLGLQYDGAFANEMNYFLRADFVGQSEQFVSEANLGTIPSRELLNLRAGLSGDRWSAELWVKNATDESYVSNAFYIPNPFFIALVPTFGNERRIGLDLSYSF